MFPKLQVPTQSRISFMRNSPKFWHAQFLSQLPILSVNNRCQAHGSWQILFQFQKEKVVLDINKHLRPISLTCCLPKLAEKFVIEEFVGPAILKHIDPNQFGGIPRSSSTIALNSMLHTWAEATMALEILYEFSL